MNRSLFYILFVFSSFIARNGQAVYPFVSTYQDWISPSNSFIEYDNTNDTARVIFCGSASYADNGTSGTRPTVSEGMGYGLLLAYANNDQATFDKFLRYILEVSTTYGCSLFSPTEGCLSPCPFLMPWVVNSDNSPFWYASSPTSTSYFSSGSATDSDIQIAWGIYLASKNVLNNTWANSTFPVTIGGITENLTYTEIFNQMATQVRFNDVTLRRLLYTPGSQWGKSGRTVLYPGYFTPQAFLALDNAPAPDISTQPPSITPNITTDSTLTIIFKNVATKTVSIDYLGGTGNLSVTPGFVPKSGSTTGFTVGAFDQPTATFTNPGANYANATIQATFYFGPQGQKKITCKYFFEFNNNQWTVVDQSDQPNTAQLRSVVQTSNSNGVANVGYVFLKLPGIDRIDFKFSDLVQSCLVTLFNSQAKYLSLYNNVLLPNVIYYKGSFPNDNFSYFFGYDSCRFALWAGAFLQSNPLSPYAPAIHTILNSLLGVKGVANFIQNGTLPSGGIDVITNMASGNYSSPAIPLNASVMTGAILSGNPNIYNLLSSSVLNYQITDNQPAPTDPIGNSTPYYNAVLKLLSEAILNQKL